MAAIRAEMPGIAVGFASIGLRHGVRVLFLWKVSGLKSHSRKHNGENGRKRKSELAAISFSLNAKAPAA